MQCIWSKSSKACLQRPNSCSSQWVQWTRWLCRSSKTLKVRRRNPEKYGSTLAAPIHAQAGSSQTHSAPPRGDKKPDLTVEQLSTSLSPAHHMHPATFWDDQDGSAHLSAPCACPIPPQSLPFLGSCGTLFPASPPHCPRYDHAEDAPFLPDLSALFWPAALAWCHPWLL